MKQKRLIEKILAIVIMVVLVFSTLNVGSANAADQKTPTGNPVPVGDRLPPALKAAPAEFKDIQPDQDIRVIIQLKDQPLARYEGGVKGLQATSNKITGQKQLDADTPVSKSYMGYLMSKQAQFKTKLNAALPNVKIERQYQVVLNAVSASIKGADVDAIKAMPEVTFVSLEKEHKLDMYTSIPLIGLGKGDLGYSNWQNMGLWAALGGPQNAGKGIRIADIDSGITPDHPCFDGTTYLYPAGFPRGDRTVVNRKIIAGYSYFRPDDPPFYPATARDDPAVAGGGHGTHTAGTLACNYGTPVPYDNAQGESILMSGVAPRAQLMIYRVFYQSVSGSNSAWTPELIAAIEQAVKDKADVVNNSWGGPSTSMYDAETLAFNAAIDSGLIVVFSAGNEGTTGNSSIGSPGTGEQFITVGATTTNTMIFESTVSAVSRSDGLAITPFSATGWGPLSLDLTGEIVSLDLAGYSDVLACNGPLPWELVAGKIVLVRRGNCYFVDQAANAAASGAIGIIVYNADGGDTNLNLVKGVIPLVTIKNSYGHDLLTYMQNLPQNTTLTVNLSAGKAAPDTTSETDMIADFSSRGPNIDLSIKPDIMAPGVNILSSVSPLDEGGTPDFDFYQGTSMAAPHVTGAAALLHQLKGWNQAQIKSAFMSTASETVKTLDPQTLKSVIENNPTQRGAGRLNLASPDKVGVTFDKPSLSYKVLTANVTKSIEIKLTNVTSSKISYTITATDTSGVGTVPEIKVSGIVQNFVDVPAYGSAKVEFSYTPSTTGQNYGEITFVDQASAATPTLHIPYFAQVNSALPPADVLIIDDDLSPTSTCPDYSSVYTNAISNLGMSYALYDVVANHYMMDFNLARNYKFTIIFTGTCDKSDKTAYDLSWNGNEFRSFVADGGKVLIFGEDTVIWDYILQQYGLEVTYRPELMLAATLVQDNLFRSMPIPNPTMKGDTTASEFMAGQFYTLNTTDTSVDELGLVSYGDMDQLPLVRANAFNAVGEGLLGTSRFSDPSIERVQKKAMWTRLEGKNDLGEIVYGRTAVYSFGLEAVDDYGGGNSSLELLARTFQFLDDQPKISPSKPTFYGGLRSNMTLSVVVDLPYSNPDQLNSLQYQNRALYYRWDFGDRTPIQYGGPTMVHRYTRFGTYQVYVEVMDGFGHRAVSDPIPVKIISVPSAPQYLKITGTSTHNPIGQWTRRAPETTYYLEIYSYAKARTIITQYVDAINCGPTTCLFTMPYLSKGKYSFKIRAASFDVWGPFGLPKIFTVTAN